MKKLMFTIGMLMYAAAEGNGGNGGETAKPAAPPLDSEKLRELKAKLVAQDKELTAATDFDARMKVMGEMMATQGAIATEEAAIKKANVAAAVKAAQDAKVAKITNFETAVLADAKVQSGKGTAEEKQASANALTVLRDELKNELLGSVKAPAQSAGTSNAGGGKGETGKAIIALHEANLAAGMTATESKKKIGETINPKTNAVYARGTIGAEVLAWEKLNGAK